MALKCDTQEMNILLKNSGSNVAFMVDLFRKRRYTFVHVCARNKYVIVMEIIFEAHLKIMPTRKLIADCWSPCYLIFADKDVSMIGRLQTSTLYLYLWFNFIIRSP